MEGLKGDAHPGADRAPSMALTVRLPHSLDSEAVGEIVDFPRGPRLFDGFCAVLQLGDESLESADQALRHGAQRAWG